MDIEQSHALPGTRHTLTQIQGGTRGSARVGSASPDLVIVGASAAGLAAAISAARAGADVTLVEQKAAIGSPPAPAIVGFDRLWPDALPAPAGCARGRLAGVHLRGSDGRGPVVDAPLTVFDRVKFDIALAREAERAGASILTGMGDVRVRPDRTIHAPGLDLTPRVILFADGARTQAARFLRPVQDADALAWGAILEVEAGGDVERLPLTFGPHAQGGRSQLTPLDEGSWSHWTFFRGDPAQAERVAARAFDIDAGLAGWSDVTPKFVGIAPDPVYTLPRELTRQNILVAGGAAGQGGLEVGLASGWMAGWTAARHVAGKCSLSEYERTWKRRYQGGYARLRMATDALAHLTDAEVRSLLGAWDGVRLPAAPRIGALVKHPRGVLGLMWSAWLAQARG